MPGPANTHDVDLRQLAKYLIALNDFFDRGERLPAAEYAAYFSGARTITIAAIGLVAKLGMEVGIIPDDVPGAAQWGAEVRAEYEAPSREEMN